MLCPNCGNPISNYKSTSLNVPLNVANENFEQRIFQYEKAGYKLKKRNSESVIMFKAVKKVTIIIWIGYSLFLLAFMLFAFLGIDNSIFETGGFIAIFVFVGIICLLAYNSVGNATITLTRTGELEERGNVLR